MRWLRTPFVKWGLGSGFAVCAVMFGPSALFGPHPEWMSWGQIVGYSAMVLCMSATYFAMREDRARRGGRIGYGAALATGVGVALAASVLFGCGTSLFYLAWGDALPEAILAFYTDRITHSGMPQADIDRQLAEMASMRHLLFDPWLQGAVMAATLFPIGLLESLIGAALVRRA